MRTFQKYDIKEPAYEILVLIAVLSNEGSGEPMYFCRLLRAFAVRIHIVCIYLKNQTRIYTSSFIVNVSIVI